MHSRSQLTNTQKRAFQVLRNPTNIVNSSEYYGVTKDLSEDTTTTKADFAAEVNTQAKGS